MDALSDKHLTTSIALDLLQQKMSDRERVLETLSETSRHTEVLSRVDPGWVITFAGANAGV